MKRRIVVSVLALLSVVVMLLAIPYTTVSAYGPITGPNPTDWNNYTYHVKLYDNYGWYAIYMSNLPMVYNDGTNPGIYGKSGRLYALNTTSVFNQSTWTNQTLASTDIIYEPLKDNSSTNLFYADFNIVRVHSAPSSGNWNSSTYNGTTYGIYFASNAATPTPTPTNTPTPTPTPTPFYMATISLFPTPEVSERKFYTTFTVTFNGSVQDYTYYVESYEPLEYMKDNSTWAFTKNMLTAPNGGGAVVWRWMSDHLWHRATNETGESLETDLSPSLTYPRSNVPFQLDNIATISGWSSNYSLYDDSGKLVAKYTDTNAPVTPTPAATATPTPALESVMPTGLYTAIGEWIHRYEYSNSLYKVKYIFYMDYGSNNTPQYYVSFSTLNMRLTFNPGGVIWSSEQYFRAKWNGSYFQPYSHPYPSGQSYATDIVSNLNASAMFLFGGNNGQTNWPTEPINLHASPKFKVYYSNVNIYTNRGSIYIPNNYSQIQLNGWAPTPSGWDQFLDVASNVGYMVTGFFSLIVWVGALLASYFPPVMEVLKSMTSFLPVELWAMTMAVIVTSFVLKIFGRESR